jgi:DNA-binding GntR family transcriptional regulator
MSPAHVLEPTYHSLKRRLLEGVWPTGLRLDATRLADDLGVSVTPIRDCLNRLVGERLVDFRAQEGYRVARVSERTLRDLFGFVAALLDLAVQAPHPWDIADEAWPDGLDHASRTAALFSTIASLAGNVVLSETMDALGERLHATRRLELALFPDAEQEIADLTLRLACGNGSLRDGLAAYHERRRRAVARFIELLEKPPK